VWPQWRLLGVESLLAWPQWRLLGVEALSQLPDMSGRTDWCIRKTITDLQDLALIHVKIALRMDWVSRHQFLGKRMVNTTFAPVFKSNLAPDQWLWGENTGVKAPGKTIPLPNGPLTSRSCGQERPIKQLKLKDAFKRGARYRNDVSRG